MEAKPVEMKLVGVEARLMSFSEDHTVRTAKKNIAESNEMARAECVVWRENAKVRLRFIFEYGFAEGNFIWIVN